MNKRILVAIIVVLLATNAAVLYHSLHANDVVLTNIPPSATLPPPVNSVPNSAARPVLMQETITDLTWPEIQKTKVVSALGSSRVEFGPALQNNENGIVRVSGVLFFLKDGIENDKVKWCVLLPPSRISCCGISCDPHQELMFYVDCSHNPWPKPDGKMLAVVQGRLRLRHDDSSWCLYTLDDALVTPLTGSAQ